MWLGLKLLASGAGNWLLRGLSAAGKWVLADWRNFAVALLVPLYLSVNFILVPRLRDDLAATRALLASEEAAHAATIRHYIDASAEAQREAEANAARVKAEQEKITDATLATYRADLAALRVRFDRLRAGEAAGNSRGADPAGLPGAGNAPSRAAAPAAEDRLPAAGGLSLDDALIASEQALQLNALIDWTEAQSRVPFTPEGSR
jgi:hypothetical protein